MRPHDNWAISDALPLAFTILLTLFFCGHPLQAEDQQVAQGRTMFTRTWGPHDPLAHGDGLGPMFNETSCVACHSQNGPGGGGPAAKNAQILAMAASADAPPEQRSADQATLAKIHPGFAKSGSIIYHR